MQMLARLATKGPDGKPQYRPCATLEEPALWQFDEDEVCFPLRCPECNGPMEAEGTHNRHGANRSYFCPGCRQFYDKHWVQGPWVETGQGLLNGHYTWHLRIKKVPVPAQDVEKPAPYCLCPGRNSTNRASSRTPSSSPGWPTCVQE